MSAKALEQQFSPESAAQKLEVSVATIWREIKRYQVSDGREGIGPTYKLGRKLRRIPESALKRFLDGKMV